AQQPAHRARHRHHRPGRAVPRRAAARQGVRRPRRGPRPEQPAPRAGRASRPRRAPAHRRPHRHVQPAAGAARRPARRGLQPGRRLVRRLLLGQRGPDHRRHRQGRAHHAGGGAPALRRPPRRRPGRRALLPGLELGDVRRLPRVAAARAHAAVAAVAVRREQGVRPPHDHQLPRVLRHARLLGHPLQPRVAAAGRGVRDAQGQQGGGGDQPGPGRRAGARQPRGPARLGLRRRLRRGDVADAPAGGARRLRHRHRRDPLDPRPRRRGLPARRHRRLERPRPARPGAHPAGGGGPPGGRCEQGARGARLEAAGRLRGAGLDDGGRRRRGAPHRLV
ncbi:MAG: GDP-mannose 4,6-dehydratase, partial [uncultured Nocardioides sp.]